MQDDPSDAEDPFHDIDRHIADEEQYLHDTHDEDCHGPLPGLADDSSDDGHDSGADDHDDESEQSDDGNEQHHPPALTTTTATTTAARAVSTNKPCGAYGILVNLRDAFLGGDQIRTLRAAQRDLGICNKYFSKKRKPAKRQTVQPTANGENFIASTAFKGTVDQ